MAHRQNNSVNVTASDAPASNPIGTQYRRLLKRKQVLERTSLSNSAMYELIGQRRFPQPVKPTGGRASAWVEEEVEQFIASCIADRDAQVAA